jgi:hypothetical protein
MLKNRTQESPEDPPKRTRSQRAPGAVSGSTLSQRPRRALQPGRIRRREPPVDSNLCKRKRRLHVDSVCRKSSKNELSCEFITDTIPRPPRTLVVARP